jgi:dolichol-phosphate mannosyltransferase
VNGPLQISVIMPALNEEKNLAAAVANVFDAFSTLGIAGEVIIVNDGSNDSTGEVARSLQQKFGPVRVITHPFSKGIGAAFWAGVAEASGEAITMLPGDGENDAFEILRYFPLLREVDVIIPFVFNHEARKLGRRIVSKIYKSIINLTFGILLNYMNGTVVYRRQALRSISLHSTGFFYQTELLIKAIRKGYLYAEVPCALRQRKGGVSKALSLKSLVRLSRDYLVTLVSVFTDPESTLGKGLHPDTATYRRKRDLLQQRQAH